MADYLELYEEYDKTGTCVVRRINGVALPHDEHPSVQFNGDDIKNARWVTTKKYMTTEEAKHRYGYSEIGDK